MQLSRLRPLNLSSFIFFTNTKEFASFCLWFYIRVEALYTLKHHPAESVTSDFFIADPILSYCTVAINAVTNSIIFYVYSQDNIVSLACVHMRVKYCSSYVPGPYRTIHFPALALSLLNPSAHNSVRLPTDRDPCC